MNRRTLLAGVSCGMVGLSGCMSIVASLNGAEYESCNHEIIKFSSLPRAVKKEVRTAFDEGEYQTSGQLLYAQVEGSNVEALERDQTYYKSEINKRQGEKSKLSFEETIVTKDFVVNLQLLNVTEETWEGTVTATDLDGDRIVDEEVTVESNPATGDGQVSAGEIDVDPDRITKVPLTDEYGEYEISISPVGGESERTTIQIGNWGLSGDNNIVILEDGIEENVDWEGLAESPTDPCSWNGKKVDNGY